MMLYYQTKFGSKRTSMQFRRYSRKSYRDYISPRCDLDTEDSEPIFLHDTPPRDNTPPYQVCLKMVESGSRDIVRKNSNARTDGRTDTRMK